VTISWGDNRPDTALVEKLRDERSDVEDLVLERVGCGGRGLDPASERARCGDRR
jgi:hypothetical protein